MDISIVSELVKPAGALISALVGLLRINRQFQPLVNRRSKEIESLEFISAFLAFDITRRNRLVVEQTFEIYLKKRLSFEEIQAVLGLANPLRAFRLLCKVGQYVLFNSEIKSFEYRSFVSTEKKRNIHSILNALGYIFFAFLGILLFLYSPELVGNSHPLVYLPLGFVSLALLFLSYLFLEDVSAISAASLFLNEAENKVT